MAAAAATTAVLNLDASVVLLTPLYVHIARRVGLPAWYLGAQPLVLSFLASSFLAVSNLTNLIAVGRLGLGEGQFLLRLGPPSVVATHSGMPSTGAGPLLGESAARPAAAPHKRRWTARTGGLWLSVASS